MCAIVIALTLNVVPRASNSRYTVHWSRAHIALRCHDCNMAQAVGGRVMSLQRFLVACAAVLAASMSASYAGPCSHEIGRMLAEIDAKLEAKAAAGPSARESTAATMHRQPTPGSIAAAETRLGDVSSQKVETVAAAMVRARKAYYAGDQSACEQALADVQRALGP